jgi:tetratricopeptide (TPR) repeat protein
VAERRAWLVVALVAAITYATALGATFHFDDAHAVVENASVHSWSAWLASMPGIRPLTKASYTLNWTLSPEPFGFAIVGVACHTAGAVAVLLLVRGWMPVLAPAVRRPGFAALAAALVFALHPAQTEAVTYIGGRSVVLSGCLYLWALFAFERSRSAAQPARWLALSLLSFALALAARETAWTLPFAIVLMEIARGETWRTAGRRAAPHLLLLVFGLAAIGASPVYRRLLALSFELRNPAANLFAQVEGVGYLITQPLLSLRVNFDPDVALPSAPDAHWWFAASAIVGALLIGAAQLRRRPWLGVGIVWFFLHLAPTNGVIARYDLVNDRQLYLALIGPALMAGVVLARLRPPSLASVTASVLVFVLGIATLVRNTDYASELALWRATVLASPKKARAWNNFGFAQQQSGNREGARAAYLHALALDPAYYKARLNLDALDAR